MSAPIIPARGATYKSAQHPGETLRVIEIISHLLSAYNCTEIRCRTESADGTPRHYWRLQPVVFAHMIRAEGWEASE